jgi:hemerythrin-like metal-binding protein
MMQALHIPWKESFKSGFPSIDDQHKHLISLINELFERLAENCPVEDMRYYLSDIHELIGFHFREEEALMRECQYAGFARHKADHDRLLQEIGDIRRTLTERSDSAEKAALARTIDDWFSVHFRTYDKAFHELRGAA